MAQLLRYDPADVATESTLNDLRSEFHELRSEFHGLRTEVRTELAAVNQRLDRLLLTLLVGMFGVVAALIGVILTLS